MKLNTQCPHCETWFFSRKARHHHQMQAHRPLTVESQQAYKDRVRDRATKKALRRAEVMRHREMLKALKDGELWKAYCESKAA
jgi:hypothetical protein